MHHLGSHASTTGRRLGYGLLPLAIEGRPSEDDALKALRAAVDAGFRVIDTADIYGIPSEDIGYSETLLAKAFGGGPRSEEITVATKGGLFRAPDGSRSPNGAPEYLRAACDASLRRLSCDAIDLYQLHRPDPDVPFVDSLGALRDLVDAGKVRTVGLSNVSPEQIRSGMTVLGPERFVAVQNRFSVEHPHDSGVLEVCRELDLTFLAWGPLGGVGSAGGLTDRVPALRSVAGRLGVSVHLVALAWVLSHGENVIPVVGARSVRNIRDSAESRKLRLTVEDMALLTPSTR